MADAGGCVCTVVSNEMQLIKFEISQQLMLQFEILYHGNHLIKTTPESTFGLHFDSFKLQHHLLRNLKFYQLHFVWAPL